MEIFILLIFIFVLAAFLGKELISKVPSQLHTPLMAATNAIAGITIVGAIVAIADSMADAGPLGRILSVIAIILATINIVGGYLVAERMLGMFRKKEDKDK
ncbi:MAG: NAD(P) transhydrogenase subunit alpha [Defluviitaleaceae bacterium]|nr:NAD(P) transhydrogenase subunit alpha [Defluviitaleaceae bacterium]